MKKNERNAFSWQGWIADSAIFAVSLSALAIVGLTFWNQFTGPAPNLREVREDREVDKLEKIIAAGHRIGPADADIVIVEFVDYECPFCRRAEGALRRIREEFAERVAVVYLHYPLQNHPNAYDAARFVECGAKQGRFEQVHHLLFSAITLQGLDPAAVASDAEVPDSSEFVRCVAQEHQMGSIEEDIKIAKDLELPGVPAVVFQGTLLGTPPDSVELVMRVREELGLTAEGTQTSR